MKKFARLWISLTVNMAIIIVVKYKQYEGLQQSCAEAKLPDDTQCAQLKNIVLPIKSMLWTHNMQMEEKPKMPTTLPNASMVEGWNHNRQNASNSHPIPTLYIITTTYQRDTQKASLVTLCQTLMHVRSLVWIVVENSTHHTPMVRALLKRCGVPYVHLTVPSPNNSLVRPISSAMGIRNHNVGLKWVREHNRCVECNGVIYFGNDDDRYDLRLFDELRKTATLSVFMVGLTGGLLMEGPYCQEGRVAKWHHVQAPPREAHITMQGFAINLRLIMKQNNVWFERHLAFNSTGYINVSKFVSRFLPNASLECRTYNNEVLVWRSSIVQPETFREPLEMSDMSIEF
ncbi:hypothetical protein EMCRGX_G016813 [Ephydatia muelleri]